MSKKPNSDKVESFKDPFYKKMWFWMLIGSALFIIMVVGSISANRNALSSSQKSDASSSSYSPSDDSEKSEIEQRASIAEEKRLKSLEQAVPSTETFSSTSPPPSSSTAQSKSSKTTSTPTEYLTALNKAVFYSSRMYMSKAGIYNQLTSEYGEKYSSEAAQYAIDNLVSDYNANALKKAKDYQSKMNMSPESIRDQLVSDYGEKFTPEEAEYAIQHLNN